VVVPLLGVAMSAADEGRTERATQKQRDKHREEGSVAKSQELSTMAQFMTAFSVLTLTGGYLFDSMAEVMRYSYGQLTTSFEGDLYLLLNVYFTRFVLMMLPMFAALFLSVIVVSRFQFEFKISWKAIQPKAKKLNPFANFKKVMISKNSLMEMVKFTLKIAIMSFLAWLAIRPVLPEYASLFQLEPFQIMLRVAEQAAAVWLMVIAFMLVLGIGDFTWQKYQHEDKMKMTKQQVKDEMKQAQGDPKVKQRQRMRAMEMMRSLMEQGAREADVVITNPTHFAVALAYKHGKMSAPKVVATDMARCSPPSS